MFYVRHMFHLMVKSSGPGEVRAAYMFMNLYWREMRLAFVNWQRGNNQGDCQIISTFVDSHDYLY